MRTARWCGLVLLGATVSVWGCGDDDGGANSNDNGNGNNQVTPICGNGAVEAGEECDDGVSNSDIVADACRSDCRFAWCGDGVVDTGEACDEAGANSDLLAGACRRSCELWRCGDGTLDPGEDCDDLNGSDGDGCSSACAVEPNWQCRGVPSQCECVTHRSGPQCGTCVVYVDIDAPAGGDGASWAGAFEELQTGIDAAEAAGAPCEVWVAEGTYVVWRTTPADSIVLRQGVAVYGGFRGDETQRAQRDWRANETRLHGGDTGTQRRVLHVVRAEQTGDATLDGFVVSGGRAQGYAPEDQSGAGLFLSGAEVWVRRCRFEDHEAASTAGGAAVVVADSAAHLSDLELVDNDGGAVRVHSSELVLTDSTIHRNAGASAIYVEAAYAQLQGVMVSDNEHLPTHASAGGACTPTWDPASSC